MQHEYTCGIEEPELLETYLMCLDTANLGEEMYRWKLKLFRGYADRRKIE